MRAPAFGTPDPRDFKATDVVSADVASSPTHLTATIRVRDLSVWRTESIGIEFAYGFTIGSTRFGLEARRSSSREGSTYFDDSYTLWRMSGGSVGREMWRYAGRAAGWFGEDESEIVLYVELAKLGLTGRSRGDVTQLRVSAKQVEDGLAASRSHTVDDAESKARYRLGTPSCSYAYKSSNRG